MTASSPDPVLPVFLDALRRHRRITFVLADDLADHCGLTNLDDAVVFLDRANTDGEMRATIGHELIHLACPDCPEDEVEQRTAELLIPLSAALAAKVRGDLHRVADELGVDAKLVRARLRGLDNATSGAAG